MKLFKIAAVTFALIGFSATAQAADFNKSTVMSQTTVHAPALVKKTRTIRVVKSIKNLPTARNVATHATRSVLFYNPSVTRTKIISAKAMANKTPNHFNG